MSESKRIRFNKIKTNNAIMINMSNKNIITDKYKLIKFIHNDSQNESIFRLWHLVNESGIGSDEYTLCGLAIPDSNINFEGFEAKETKLGGKITCKDCLNFLNWCKSLRG